MLKKYIIHTFGFLIISLGIVGVIFAGLGATPIDAFNYFIYKIVPLSLGTIVIITGLSVSALAFFFNREKEMIISVGFIFLVGIFIDIWKLLFELLPAATFDNYFLKIPVAISSLILITFGVAITITTNLPASPYEKLMLVLDMKVNSLMWSKVIIEGTFFAFAVILGLYTGRLFEQVHIFTFALVILSGPMMSFFANQINKIKNKGDKVYETKLND